MVQANHQRNFYDLAAVYYGKVYQQFYKFNSGWANCVFRFPLLHPLLLSFSQFFTFSWLVDRDGLF